MDSFWENGRTPDRTPQECNVITSLTSPDCLLSKHDGGMTMLLLLFFISFVPLVAGVLISEWISNLFPVGICIAFQCLLLLLWFVIGRFAATKMTRLFSSVFAAHAVGFISFAVFLWQYLSYPLKRIEFLHRISYLYPSSVPIRAICANNNYFGLPVTKATPIIVYLLSLFVLIAVFWLGFALGRKKTGNIES